MGAVVGSALAGPCLWASEGRSAESAARAEAAGLIDVGTVEALVGQVDVILSICPPEAAETLAASVAEAGFTGTYVDANAISPATARRVGDHFEHFIDGGIVGPPPTAEGLTRLYVSGSGAPAVVELFGRGPLEVRTVDGGAGAASAIKMCFASWTKGTSALLLAIRALAEAEGVEGDLLGEWQTSMPHMADLSATTAAQVGPKAWRFEAEMREIASTFADRGLPDDFHQGAAEIYRRLAPLKGHEEPSLAEALNLLTSPPGR